MDATEARRERKVGPGELPDRTKKFALRIIRLYSNLPRSTVAQVIGKQLLRSGTSLGAHYHESMRARSNAEYISKLEVGLQELEETRYWMELLVESETFKAPKLSKLQEEANELSAMIVACVKRAKARANK